MQLRTAFRKFLATPLWSTIVTDTENCRNRVYRACTVCVCAVISLLIPEQRRLELQATFGY